MLILLLPQKHLQQKLRHKLKVVWLVCLEFSHVCADGARLFPIFKNKLMTFLLFHLAQNRGNLLHEQHESLVQIRVLISSRLLIHLLRKPPKFPQLMQRLEALTRTSEGWNVLAPAAAGTGILFWP